MSQLEQNEDETQLEETQYVETQELEPGILQDEEEEVVVAPQKRKKPGKKDNVMREPGKTLFPMSRVQKIIKADKVYRYESFFYTYDKLTYIILLGNTNYCKGCNFLDFNSDRGNDKATL
jgi:hypothetical protein